MSIHRLALFRFAPAIGGLALGCGQSGTSVGNIEQAVTGCMTASAGQTQASTIATQNGVFEASWDVTPASGTDAGVGLSPLSNPSGWTSMATITRFFNGVIDVRDYDTYRADAAMSWTAGSTYHVRTIVDVAANTYSVFVAPSGGSEQTLATNYRFRLEQQGATQLITSIVYAEAGSITACGLSLSPCVTAAAGQTLSTAFPQLSGPFSVSWDMTPLSTAIDAAVALAPMAAPSAWTDLATIVRFATSPSDVIDARDGGVYQADVSIPWVVNGNYRVRLAVDIEYPQAQDTYSIHVTAPGGSEQTLGAGYLVRSEQSSDTELKTWVVKSGTGSARACNFQYTDSGSAYNGTVLADDPVAFWGMTAAGSTETDLSGNGRTGSYVNGTPTTSTMPNGDAVVVFNGSNQYLTVASNASLSIPTTHSLTWEAWIRPDTLDFPHNLNGYVDFMGKCEQYSPTCEWEARMYDNSLDITADRCNRLSAYAFNPTADKGAGAFWQQATPACSLLVRGNWYHVVGEYTTLSQPADCLNTGTYPGSIDIWVNGIKWDQAVHGQTGCMSQYQIIPTANGSSFRIGTMAGDSWFEGAIGKVAIYNYLLTPSQISAHYQAMTGQAPPSQGCCTDTCSFTGGCP